VDPLPEAGGDSHKDVDCRLPIERAMVHRADAELTAVSTAEMLLANLNPANGALCSKGLHCVPKGESAWAVRTAAILLDVLPHKWFVTQ
jgi:hypothetical protein